MPSKKSSSGTSDFSATVMRSASVRSNLRIPEFVVYVFAHTRSGSVPAKVLGDSAGRLVVDQHTGYISVTKPGQRVRAGCMAHARRKIFEQKEHPETKAALELIGEIYAIEREVKRAEKIGAPEHLAVRKARSRQLFVRLLPWGRTQRAAAASLSGAGHSVAAAQAVAAPSHQSHRFHQLRRHQRSRHKRLTTEQPKQSPDFLHSIYLERTTSPMTTSPEPLACREGKRTVP